MKAVWIFSLLSLITISAAQSSSSKLPEALLQHDSILTMKLKGKNIEQARQVFPKLKAIGASTFAVSDYKWGFETWSIPSSKETPGAGDRLLVLSKTKNVKPGLGAVLSDALRYSNSKNFSILIGPCSQVETNEPAVAQMKMKSGKWAGIIQAWVADSAVGKLSQIDAKSVRCDDPDEIGE